MEYHYTNIEQLLCNELTIRNIHFVTQFPTESGFVLDFVIPPNIVIETDGPCHDSAKARKRDWFRDKVLRNEGWIVHRLNYKIMTNPIFLKQHLDIILLSK